MNKENIIKATKTRTKENHPRFNPNKPQFQEYVYKVRLITEKNLQ